jgi:HK97 family phage major capsid protein
MSQYDRDTNRDDIEGVVTEDVASSIIQSAAEKSAALALFPHVRMSQKVRRLPVLSALPTAYWVDGEASRDDTTKGLKSTTSMAWDKKYLEAEELAVIVPIHENVLDDSTFDIFGEVRPRLSEAIGAKLDLAVFGGTELPASWATNGFNGLVPDAISAGNTRELGTATQGNGGVAEDLNQLFAKVEADGFDVSGVAAERTFRALIRSARDTTGQKLGDLSPSGAEILGAEVKFCPSGTLDGEIALAGDMSQGILGIRSDLSYKVLTEAVIQDNHGEIIYNLAQQDMVALRVTFRAAFQVANPMNRSNDNDSTRYPFAVLRNETP